MYVRIYPLQKKTNQSALGREGQWVVQYETLRYPLDSLTGWTGRQNNMEQKKFFFQNREQAISYATRHGLRYHLEKTAPRKIKGKNYADNFKRNLSKAP